MAVISTGSHPKALWPGVHAFVMGKYDTHPAMWSKMFTVETSSMAYEEDVETTGFGLPSIKTEGGAVVYEGQTQGFTKRYTHVAYNGGYIVTKEELADNLYKSRGFRRGEQLSFSFTTAKEIVHANVLNRAFDANYLGGDAKELCATDHATLAGNQQNELTTAADLSEASLEDMLVLIKTAKNSKGLQINLVAKKLIVSPFDQYNATRILKSDLQNDTSLNAVNAIKSLGMIGEGIMVNPFLTDADAWFLSTNAPNGLMHFTRQGFEFTQDNDFDTSNAKFKGYERYSAGWTDWRAVFGTPGV